MRTFALILWLAAACSLFAQSDRGSINGSITDPTGAAIPAAKVQAVNQATGVVYPGTATDAGAYVIPQLPVGRYDISVEAAGFRRYVRRDIEVNVGQTITMNLAMEIGQVEQVLEVTAAPPLVESTTSDVSTIVTERQVIDLPLAVAGNMRNPEAFIFLTPGVTTDNPQNPTANVQINGSPSRSREILLDGASAASPESGGILFTYPSVEAIGEFRQLSTNFSAEYGRTGGGFQIYTTRSGTNELHGSLFDYFRNEALDARGFFAARRPVNRQNEFGGALGGPVYVPGLYNGRNKTFFHFVYGGFRWRAGAANELLTLPPDDFRRGDFSRLRDAQGRLIRIFDPQTGQPFANNQIPQERFSQVARNILPLLPATTNNNITNNFLAVGAQEFNRDQYNVKLDHAFSDNNRISGYLYINDQANVDPERLPVPFSSGLDQGYKSRWARINHDLILSPATLNHLILGFTRENQYWQRLSANQSWPEQLGIKGVNTGEGNTFPVMTFTDSYTWWGDVSTTATNSKSVGRQVNNVFQITDNVTHVRGKHTLKFGADGRWYQTNGADPVNSQGRFDFRAASTASPVAAERATTGNAFASFLLGLVDSARYNVLAVAPAIRYKYFGTYFQDDWRVTPRLTLNLGLRYEIFFPRTDKYGNMSGFDPTLPNPGAGNILGAIAFLGEGEGRIDRSSFADTYYRNFGPRVGFAYSVNEKTVLRGGYGISYAPGNATVGLRQSQGFSVGFNAAPTWQSTNAGLTPALRLDDGIPQNFPRPPFISPTVANGFEVNYMGREDGRPPYFQNFTFSVQRELPWSSLIEAAYVGVKGTRLGTNLINLNELDPRYLSLGTVLNQQVGSAAANAAGITAPYAGFRGTVAQALRPYPQYQNVLSRSNPNGNSTYHALQTKFEKRFSRGFSVLTAYTWSKTISDADQIAGLGPAGQTYYNRALEKAISTNDIPHNIAISYLYELPFGRNRWFGGWTLTGIHQYYSGRPVVLTANNNNMPIRTGVLRPDVVEGAERQLMHDDFDPATDRWINPEAFRVPGAFRYGTAARSYTDLRGDRFLNESFGAIKRTPLTERVTLTFRAEWFNVFNRTVFALPEGNVSSAAFGRVSRQNNLPRQGQLALRVDF